MYVSVLKHFKDFAQIYINLQLYAKPYFIFDVDLAFFWMLFICPLNGFLVYESS